MKNKVCKTKKSKDLSVKSKINKEDKERSDTKMEEVVSSYNNID